ncbi:MAG TPA: hypothetical protein VGO56_06585 [Pyrinomonadaceae bacterium]|jgi:hypothetical protein|nr:hypothetical protein [Pyrinomonadaceae bacterium]
MRKLLSLSVILALLLGLTTICAAETISDCDSLRSKAEQLANMDVAAMSPSLQKLHKEALLKIYVQLSQCEREEISVVSEMSNTVAGTDAAAAVDEKLRKLVKANSDTEAKLLILRTALGIPNPDQNESSSAGRTAVGEVVTSNEGSKASDGSDVGNGTPGTDTAPASPQTFSCQPIGAYPDAPPLLVDVVRRDAQDIARGKNNGAIASVAKMTLYATLDAASPNSSEQLRGLAAYQFLSETARTDKQLGGAANSDGAVSAIEKPGFARLLGFAVEHGGITKKNDGTNLTLSTSLYSLYTLKNGDTAEAYARSGFLNRVGLFTTFAVDNQNNDLANARRQNLTEWSVKARLFGDRSTRSKSFTKFWREKVEPLIDDRLVALGQPLEDLTSKDPNNTSYRSLRLAAGKCLRDAVKSRTQDTAYQGASEEERIKILSDLMVGLVKSNVYDRIKSGEVQLSDRVIATIETQYVPNLKAALENLKAVGGVIEQKLDELQKAPLGTFAYTNHRTSTGSDFSETKFLFEQDKGALGPLKLTGNFGLSFYNRPDPTLNQQRLRDVSAALAFEGTSSSPFGEKDNQSKITYSFVGRYERIFENRNRPNRTPDVRVFQFVTEIPFMKGFSLPLSVTYLNGTEEEHKKGFRFNFGMHLDTDKLLDLLNAKP